MSLNRHSRDNSLELKEGVDNAAFEEDGGRISSENTDGQVMADCPSSGVNLDGDERSYTQIKPYAGMPKEVLLLYSGQSRYRLPREILFWLIIACMLALIALTITVIALSPRCLSWWQSTPVYQIYPRSFKDSNNDGIGDLKGIREKLDHFNYLNIKAIWISPFYKSPMKDFGYDVEDFRDIDPIFGTMADFDDLLAAMHDKGLRLIMDFIPNHSSDKHVWFQKSRMREDPYTDYYIWANCTDAKPPNNWVSVFGNSSWEYDPVRDQCYLHQFLKEQPDLNFRNPDVLREMTDVIRFWLDKGVDGFRMDAVKHMLEAPHLRNEPQVDPLQPPEEVNTEFELYHDYTYTQVGLHDILRAWRAELDKYSREPGRYRFMVTESYDYEEIGKTMMYYSNDFVRESDFPFNFYLLDLPQGLSGHRAQELVSLWMTNMPQGKWPNWVVGNHDKPRMASSVGKDYISAINMMILTLPGTPTTYYGEEIGMENVHIDIEDIQDPFGKFDPNATRDPSRSPMQWNSGLNAGFSGNETGTWLPLSPNYTTINVEAQMRNMSSVLEQYRRVSLLRESELPLHRGWMCFVWSDADVFAFLREQDGLDRAFLVLINLGQATTTDLSSISGLPGRFRVHTSTVPENNGRSYDRAAVPTAKGEGLLLELLSSQRFHTSHASSCYISERACYLSMLDIMYKC
ncbi:neutral and basic amino acid transport protein rBAT isoform X1 [Alosa sapidissima]|uniref:neutral and basic amino acid transport protein rBAT isoform X1 n=1 Tax=Alosa sapidissima TaxID=34773 RepID=UPI001C0869B8|nr:neutral and basic amino acid transport protein rBAT isoform X1 [Alosa sapidissima]